MADERATNPFMRWDSKSLANNVSAALPGASLDSPTAVFAATRQLKDKKLYMIFFQGTRIYHFGKHREEVERIVKSARFL